MAPGGVRQSVWAARRSAHVEEEMRLQIVFFALAVAAVACGSDDEGGSSGAGAAALQSCQEYCDAEVSCGDYASADECKSSECAGNDQATGACAEAIKAFYDCQKAAADVCNPGCTTEASAYLDACS
jgi:hypothetical protein